MVFPSPSRICDSTILLQLLPNPLLAINGNILSCCTAVCKVSSWKSTCILRISHRCQHLICHPLAETYGHSGLAETDDRESCCTFYVYLLTVTWGTRWRSWLRHCATSQKVASSIPDGVTGIFHWHNPSGRTIALGLTQPLTEMSTRNIPRW